MGRQVEQLQPEMVAETPPEEEIIELLKRGEKDSTEYTLHYGDFIQVKSRHSANPYWHRRNAYNMQEGDEILDTAGVLVELVGHFKNRKEFLDVMEKNFGAKVIQSLVIE